MSSEARLILKRSATAERWEHRERGDYNLERFDQEFQDRLYSEKGREIPCARQPKPLASGGELSDSRHLGLLIQMANLILQRVSCIMKTFSSAPGAP